MIKAKKLIVYFLILMCGYILIAFSANIQAQEDKNVNLTESNEEMNLNRSDVVALGNLPYLISRHKIEVHPYVGLITNEQDLKGNFEIEEIFTVPVSSLKDEKNAKMHDKIKGDIDLKIPSWDYNNQRIWGLTAMITADLINICFDGKIETNLTQIREQYDSYPRG